MLPKVLSVCLASSLLSQVLLTSDHDFLTVLILGFPWQPTLLSPLVTVITSGKLVTDLLLHLGRV